MARRLPLRPLAAVSFVVIAGRCGRSLGGAVLAALLLLLLAFTPAWADDDKSLYPSSVVGTDFDFITDADPDAFVRLEDKGEGPAEMPDKSDRAAPLVQRAFLFVAHFSDETRVNLAIDVDFKTQESARKEALRYTPRLGKLPTALRRGVDRVVVHQGGENVTAFSDVGLIVLYSDNATKRIGTHDLEETVFHESVHAAWDKAHATSDQWQDAQKKDGRFVTDYARKNPKGEDLAESALFAYALIHHPERIPKEEAAKIRAAIPNRIAFVEKLLPKDKPGQEVRPLREGQTVTVAGRQVTLSRVDDLPFVQDEYTARFTFDKHDNPKLKALRERYQLDRVVAGGKTEFDRQVLLLDWVHERFKKFGKPTSKARGAWDILEANDDGHTFFCAHYGDVLVSAAASLGWIDRALALRRPDHLGTGSTEHTSTEIWSNDHRKWILFDPTFAMYAEKDGVPLNAYELRREWFDPASRGLTFVVGKERKRYTKADLPVLRKRFDGFGDLSLDASALNVYAFIGYIPNTNLMDAGPDYGRMFITQDAIGGATKWHKRTIPKSPATDPYFPINQANLTITADGDTSLQVRVRTMTPNFTTFFVRTDDGEWKPASDQIGWIPHAGKNRLEVKTINQFGVEGPVSTVEVTAD